MSIAHLLAGQKTPLLPMCHIVSSLASIDYHLIDVDAIDVNEPLPVYQRKRWIWMREGKKCRYNDLPAVVCDNGDKEWWVDGYRMRGNDLPTTVLANGTKIWQNTRGRKHRDGNLPAVQKADGSTEYWRHGRQYQIVPRTRNWGTSTPIPTIYSRSPRRVFPGYHPFVNPQQQSKVSTKKVPTKEEKRDAERAKWIECDKPASCDDMTCIICITNQRCILLDPCNHLVLCGTCALAFTQKNDVECPVCRRKIRDMSRVFL